MTIGAQRRLSVFLVAIVSVMMVPLATAGAVFDGLPDFSKQFSPDTIGPGGVSTLTFTIDNSDEVTAATLIAFSDVLPVAITIATPANVVSTCPDGGGRGDPPVITAPDGGGTISLTGGSLGAGASCTISVDVTSSTVGTHTNTTGDLTSSVGNSGTATDDLTVTGTLPSFSKGFSPSSIPPGGTSVLTFTVDNTDVSASDIFRLEFLDSLPTDMVVAIPGNAATDCASSLGASVTAEPGATSISFFAAGLSPSFPVVAAGDSCIVVVDVTTTTTGSFANVSDNLLVGGTGTGDATPAGTASATLEVIPQMLDKLFTDDPVPPGGTATLQFTINNFDRSNAMTAIGFTDDLATVLTGLTATGLPLSDPCGTGSVLAGSAGDTLLTLAGGSLPAGGSCTFSVSVSVPGGAADGQYTNTTSSVTGTVGGEGVVGNAATDILRVVSAPVITKEFTDDPVGAGGAATLVFTITNTSTTSAATNVSFSDQFNVIMPTAATPTSDCGGTVTFTPLSNPAPPSSVVPATLSLTGGTLAASSSCTISIVLDVLTSAAEGIYANTTSVITATVGGNPVAGLPAEDSLTVRGGPTLRKVFSDDPVLPGGTATLQFDLTHAAEAPGDATSITFTDDLTFVSGVTASGLPLTNICGVGSSLTGSVGDTLLTFAGGTLAPGGTCSFSLTVDVSASAPLGSHTNTTSAVSSMVLGVGTAGSPGEDDLDIAVLSFGKEFIDDPVRPGESATLRFTIGLDASAPGAATAIEFDDVLNTVIPGYSVTLPASGFCGTGSTIIDGTIDTGLTGLVVAGAEVAVGGSCSFDVIIDVPAGMPTGSHNNSTSDLTATISERPVTIGPATDALVVELPLPPLLTKEFTDDPVSPGDTATMEFTIEADPSGPGTMTLIEFDDDLAAVLTGLTVVTPLPTTPCGAGSSLTSSAGDTYLELDGGSLEPGDSCTFSVQVLIPVGATPASYTNTTTAPSGTFDAGTEAALTVTGEAASDVLEVSTAPRLTLTKEFTDDPVPAGGVVTLEFTITHTGGDAAAAFAFNDDLDATLTGLVATGLPAADVCGSGSQLSGTSLLTFTGGSLEPATSCTFTVTLAIPGDATGGTYPNTTSDILIQGLTVGGPGTDDLQVTVKDDGGHGDGGHGRRGRGKGDHDKGDRDNGDRGGKGDRERGDRDNRGRGGNRDGNHGHGRRTNPTPAVLEESPELAIADGGEQVIVDPVTAESDSQDRGTRQRARWQPRSPRE